jgi:hypothetical protein
MFGQGFDSPQLHKKILAVLAAINDTLWLLITPLNRLYIKRVHIIIFYVSVFCITYIIKPISYKIQ